MKYLISFFIIFQVIVAITPPIAPIFPEELTIHDDTRIDNYYWLNHRDDDLVIKYLIEENQYRDSAMAHTSLLRQTLYKEMTQRLTDSESSVPYHNNGYLYREIYPKDADYPLYQRKPNDNVNIPWTTILNVNDLSKEAD